LNQLLFLRHPKRLTAMIDLVRIPYLPLLFI
jgi:hypothetical protein